MAESVKLIDPQHIHRNPENPRLIFRQEELDALQASIEEQGILVPLTVFQDGKDYYLLDGERRWRCSIKIGLSRVPAIVQPKPERMQNLMMMFAIHNARRDWDPLPTAFKLEELEKEYSKRNGRKATEGELAGIASLSRGEVRRLKKLLQLPVAYRKELLEELEKPRSKQIITVDHVLEATKAAEALRKRKIINESEEEDLRQAILEKFRSKVIDNTVAPRKLVKLARAVERKEISIQAAKRVVNNLINEKQYSIETAFTETVEQADFEHTLEQFADRLLQKLEEHRLRNYVVSDSFASVLQELAKIIHVLTEK
jgi:ParB family transcriptional regulator, chromosome partitioning protein